MIRKQIFLDAVQDEALKRLAERTGKSEGALVREAVEMRPAQEEIADARWEALLQRWAAGGAPHGARTWHRQDGPTGSMVGGICFESPF